MRSVGTENLEVMAEARNYNAWLCSLVSRHLGDAKRVLDFGAGFGTFAIALQKADMRIVCVESDAYARTILDEAGLRSYASLDDIAPDSVEAAYTLNVLEHIEDDVAALRCLRDRLVPRGRLFVYVPAFEVLFSAMDRTVGHVRRYRRNDLVQRIEQAGFSVIRSRYADSLGFFATLLYKLIGNRTGEIDRRTLVVYDRLIFPLSSRLDAWLGSVVGKNLWVEAMRPE